jgi:hypothetical protein
MVQRHVSLADARQALQGNQALLDPETNKISHNHNIALLGICAELERISKDVERLHAKIQPILRYLSEDNNDWRDGRGRTPQP